MKQTKMSTKVLFTYHWTIKNSKQGHKTLTKKLSFKMGNNNKGSNVSTIYGIETNLNIDSDKPYLAKKVTYTSTQSKTELKTEF